jgi:glycosyltransferase involved in cell wall biosynthesis
MKPIKLNPNFATTRMVIKSENSNYLSEKKEGGLRTQEASKTSFQPDRANSEFFPLVTIITVVYNNDTYIAETINSVLSQSYDSIEYIIIDGGSTDKTLEIIRQYEANIDYWISESDRGLYDAMNKGIALARGEIIGILNSDDLYFIDTVATVVKAFQNRQQPCVIYGNMLKFADNFNQASLHQGNLTDSAFKTATISINHPTCFVHQTLYKKFGGFKPEYEVGADRELMMRFHSQEVIFLHIEQTLAKFRLGGTTSVQSLTNIFNREIIQEYKLLNTYAIKKTIIAISLFKKSVQSLRKWLFYKVLGEKLANQIIMFYVSTKFPARG